MTNKRLLPLMLLVTLFGLTLGETGCATKKYVRKTVNERVTPLEGRTQEVEETVRRNTQDIRGLDDKFSKQIDDVSGRVDRAQNTAEAANSKAIAADEHAARAEQRVEDVRANLDRYTMLNNVSINFKLNSAKLTEESKALLDSIATEAKNHAGYLLEIQGFTDSTGKVAVNDKLSQERAETVQRYLAREHQIPVYKMSILGLGELEEEVEVSSRSARREARAKNRRVDVRILINNAVNPNEAQRSALQP